MSKITHTSPYSLDCATINWLPDNTPQSHKYEDIYFLPQRGLQESRYVFLEQNRLAERWQQLDPAKTAAFTIAETGFGTGLNFLASCQLWMSTAPESHRLHFISVEKHPLTREDLSKALSNWPELDKLSQQLIKQYPVLVPGHHLINLNNGTITLHLLLGDGYDSLEQLLDTSHSQLSHQHGPKVDAWFLDGFAPAKNPELWHDKLFSLIAQLSCVGTSYATFTAAGLVRRGLAAQGFSVEKKAGFGHKREMICGQFIGPIHDHAPARKGPSAPWALPPAATTATPKSVAIIGGGLAGLHCAYAMARRGWQVKLIERHTELAQEASGNAQGMLYTKLSPQPGTLNQFTLSSYLYALRFYQQLVEDKILSPGNFNFCGLLQLSTNEAALEKLKEAFKQHPQLVNFVDPATASELAGITITKPACYFPSSGWLSPSALCQQLASLENIQLLKHAQALSLEYSKEQWQVLDADKQCLAQCDNVIIANSLDALNFQQTAHLPLKSIRGQTTSINSSRALENIRTVICHEGYLTPSLNGQHTLGATFHNNDNCRSIRPEDHRLNIESLHRAIPACFPEGIDSLTGQIVGGRVGFRCNTPDYMPIAGAAPRQQQFLEDYDTLRKNAHSRVDTPGSYYPGLFLNIGHGSRGLTSTPLCAELIAALICKEPRPLPRKLWEALSPARFIIRDLIRNKV